MQEDSKRPVAPCPAPDGRSMRAVTGPTRLSRSLPTQVQPEFYLPGACADGPGLAESALFSCRFLQRPMKQFFHKRGRFS